MAWAALTFSHFCYFSFNQSTRLGTKKNTFYTLEDQKSVYGAKFMYESSTGATQKV